MATHPYVIVRPLTAIVCDLATTNQRLTALIEGLNGRIPDTVEDRQWDDLEARKSALEAEFDAAIYAETGVSWEMLEGARA